MLRSRFNRHREIVQSTVGANMRTSESSDAGKPNSPKNSPVCPVRPTPAPVSFFHFNHIIGSNKQYNIDSN